MSDASPPPPPPPDPPCKADVNDACTQEGRASPISPAARRAALKATQSPEAARCKKRSFPPLRTSSAGNIHDDQIWIQKSDRYHCLEQIGKGQFAVVFSAIDVQTERKVALKRINVTGTSHRSLVEPLVNAKLQHPGIARMLDWFWDGYIMWIVTELVEGAELFDWINEMYDREPMDSTRITIPNTVTSSVMHQIMSALVYLHSQGIAHRDLKAENIMLEFEPDRRHEPTVKLIDFGLAIVGKPLDGERASRSDTNLISCYGGTPVYCAPEVHDRVPLIDPFLSDVWAVGMLAFMVGTGRFPFNFNKAAYRVSAIARTFIRQIGRHDFDHAPYITRQGRQFIILALQMDPKKRPTARALSHHPWLSGCARQADRNKQRITVRELSEHPHTANEDEAE